MSVKSNEVLDASNRLEELVIIGKEMVNDLRTDALSNSYGEAYRRVYYLRRELSRIVATLGAGVPSSPEKYTSHYESLVTD